MIKFIVLLTRALLLDQRQRRLIMFYTILAAMLMLFAGVTFLKEWLGEHLVVLIFYWAACAWLTILAALVSVFDILMVRIAARLMRKQLEAMYAASGEKDVTPRGRGDLKNLL